MIESDCLLRTRTRSLRRVASLMGLFCLYHRYQLSYELHGILKGQENHRYSPIVTAKVYIQSTTTSVA